MTAKKKNKKNKCSVSKDYLEVRPELFRIFSLWAADKYRNIYIGK